MFFGARSLRPSRCNIHYPGAFASAKRTRSSRDNVLLDQIGGELTTRERGLASGSKPAQPPRKNSPVIAAAQPRVHTLAPCPEFVNHTASETRAAIRVLSFDFRELTVT